MTMSNDAESKIFQEIEDMSATLLPFDRVEGLKQQGTLLFTPEDVAATSDMLVSTFRRLCVEEHVTLEYFCEKYKQYAILKLGKTPQSAANNRTNILKMLKRGDKISWKKFLELTQLVLGFKPISTSITFVKTDNKEIQISTVPTEEIEI